MIDVGRVYDMLEYPVKDGSYKRVGIGYILSATFITIIPYLLLIGFYTDVLRKTASGDFTPPDFDFSTDGLKQTLSDIYIVGFVMITYSTVMLIPVGLLVGGVRFTLGVFNITAMTRSGMIGLVTVGLILFFVGIVFFSPVSVLIYSTEKSFLSAFDPRRVIEVCYNREYIKRVGDALLVGLIGATLSGVAVEIPVIGWGIFPLILFTTYTVCFYLLGDGIKKSDSELRCKLDSSGVV